MYTDNFDVLLNSINEALKNCNKDELQKINKKTGNKLKELVDSFVDDRH